MKCTYKSSSNTILKGQQPSSTLCSYERCKQTTFQWPPESGWEEDEAPFSALRAWVSCDLRCRFIFEPAPKKTSMVKTPQDKTRKDLAKMKSGNF